MKNEGNSIKWTIHFKENKPDTFVTETQSKSLISTNNEAPHQNKKFEHPEDPEAQKKAKESLEAIVNACKEIKGECKKTIAQTTENDKLGRMNQIANELKGLFYLIIEFARLIKKLRDGQDKKGA